MTNALKLRSAAEGLASPMPALLAAADQLAQAVMLGDHGRRRAGMGDTFWQYRPAQQGDEARAIDWRRSARADSNFVADKEWQIAQSVLLWVDQSAAMQFTSDDNLPTKSARARTLALATAILLTRGGERVGLTGLRLPPKRGAGQIRQMAELLCEDDNSDFGTPDTQGLLPQGRALFISDFLGDLSPTKTALFEAASRGIKGCILQILDPQEESFPFSGRTSFQSMGGSITHETLSAAGLKQRYLDKLTKRKDALHALARQTGWQFHTHHTNTPATSALLWLYKSLEGRS
ncbi:MAG: DUF58 domain-containing protein [Yoonia sp.]|nr:DUF58 domain-containing protein [Yoonia sp.]